MVKPPGTILQGMYLNERVARLPAGRFLEIGCGSGWVSELLLKQGWNGVGIDLHARSVARSREINQRFVDAGRYQTRQLDFLDGAAFSEREKFDLIISCMVLEHLDDVDEAAYFHRCSQLLAPGGMLITIVPASEAHWGIEDEIAGHFRRYSHESLARVHERESWKVVHIAGLTYPLSNLLFSLSNALVRHAEGGKTGLTMRERTMQSGDRSVFLKTRIPHAFGILLNEWTMWPWYLIQKWSSAHPSCMVLYVESRPW